MNHFRSVHARVIGGAQAVRRAIQHSQESLRALAERHGVNQKTIAKWKRRRSTADLPTG
ncbi:helix-turn-helix domain-containing protein, partial [Sphingomonas sp.]|uniref:helix-turn-helix domain-containing protein n=1 Tax=Sphingomonas sp. TaxID=28214 RepID=UPI0031D1A8B6